MNWLNKIERSVTLEEAYDGRLGKTIDVTVWPEWAKQYRSYKGYITSRLHCFVFGIKFSTLGD
jgi:hypothetical protein